MQADADSTIEVHQQLHDGLTNYENGEPANVTNLLADTITVSNDYLTYTVGLKQGVSFHDGTEVTASDVVYSWERAVQSSNSDGAWFLLDLLGVQHSTDSNGNYEPGSLAVRASGTYTVEFDLEQPFYAVEEILAHPFLSVVPEGIVGDIDGYQGRMSYEEFATESVVGAGPFELDHRYESAEVVANAYSNYHGTVPSVDTLYWSEEPEQEDRWTVINDRDVEVFDVPNAYYDPTNVSVTNTDSKGRKTGSYGPLENGDTVNYQRVTALSVFYLGMNTQSVPAPVRKALAYLVNQDAVAATEFNGRADPAYHLTPPAIYPGGPSQYESHASNDYPYGYGTSDITSAQQVMENAGYGSGNQFSLTFSHYNSQRWSQFASNLQTVAADAYIDVSIEELSFGDLLERGRNGNLEVYTLGWITDYPAPQNVVQLVYPPRTDTDDGDGALTYTNWDDLSTQAKQDATTAFETIQSNTEPTSGAADSRASAAVTMEEANWADMIVLPMFHGVNERFYYDGVDIPLFGALGPAGQKYNSVTLNTDRGPDGSPTDPDGDGKFEDIDGDGRIDEDDAEVLFHETDQFDDPSKYDFNGNGEVNVADVQALKHETENK
ncbi:ABC transporter substrate-binding protein [Halorarius halobius]|uniref:ABC transporter substrate-binding protein n=1 Tax=Halorarius halobius TaxID=2962671 RepID=UPI0020CE5CB2|nr:ABC transporter substrate-binding protein [Halorarius halobius]